ncbi:hypothetical protein BU24DRAFT_55274 [Aaosphaeria arxii CBS 175.79]|uniref:Uncharacterized protein n=1 Tax=Aaosphaeria arxii CBS 175.79 TaxID=1450172 RepID=A0A6A5XBF1_9PLEO|nr:uncharacterized protein BU24DRAFT_55274 [Aaosphaeria arxii CBS 175.79]KAF2010298.1 hypothetical protein BU24DRAFT_55274 [Aaosphaeria arxii CBS 175.79]
MVESQLHVGDVEGHYLPIFIITWRYLVMECDGAVVAATATGLRRRRRRRRRRRIRKECTKSYDVVISFFFCSPEREGMLL